MATERFSRERLAGYDPEVLRSSAVLVVGLGAVGSNAAQNLALAGVGEIRGVDDDLFEDHNRTRSPLYPTPDEQRLLGREKARVVMSKLHVLMTADSPRTRAAVSLIEGLGDGAFEGVDVVLSCVDNTSARAYLSRRTRYLGIPLIEGGFEGPQISMSCYPANDGAAASDEPCWECSNQDGDGSFSCRFFAQQAEEQGIVPAIQNAAATLGALQAEAAILALHGQMPLGGHAVDMDVRTGMSRKVRLSRDPECPGAHERLGVEPASLSTSADDQVRDLIREVQGSFEAPALLVLPAPLVWRSVCAKCQTGIAVEAPEWAWRSNPRCRACGGVFESFEHAGIARPVVYRELSLRSPSDLLDILCRKGGLAPGSLVLAVDDSDTEKLFRLSGSADDLFEEVA